jgi:hypothetical protein
MSHNGEMTRPEWGALSILLAVLLHGCGPDRPTSSGGDSSARTWQVFADGTGDAPTIQAAIDSSMDGDTIRIGPGTYAEVLNIENKSLVLAGEGDGESHRATITKPDSLSPSNLSILFVAGNRLEIRRLRMAGSTTSEIDGGAIHALGPGHLVLRESWFENNGASSDDGLPVNPQGGAVYFQGGDSLTIEECRFVGNRGHANLARHSDPAGAAISASCTHLTIARSEFRNNLTRGTECGGTGGALRVSGPDMVIEECEFATNEASAGGAILSSGSLQIRRCTFRDNRGNAAPTICPSRPGSILEHDGQAVIEECRFENNSGQGNNIRVRGAGPFRIIGNSLVLNRQTAVGPYGESSAALAIDAAPGASVECTGNLVAGNTGAGIRHGLTDLGSVSCNIIWGNRVDFETGADFRGSNGNIGIDPRFCDPASGSGTVSADSPCLPGSPDHPGPCGVIGGYSVGCDSPR